MSALYLANSVLRSLVSGLYPMRILLPLGYITLLIGVVHLARSWPAARYLSMRWGILATRVALGAALALFATNMVLEVGTFAEHGIPQTSAVDFVYRGELTLSYLAHNHFGKSPIGALIGDHSPALVRDADTGLALLAVVPVWLPYLEAVLFLLVLGGFLLGLPRFLEHFHSRGKRVAFMILYAITTLIILQDSLDGGLFYAQALLAVCVFAALALLPARLFYKAYLLSVLAALAVISTLAMLGFYKDWGADAVRGPLGNILIFALLSLALYHTAEAGMSAETKLAFLIVLVLVGARAYAGLQQAESYLHAPSGVYAYITSTAPLQLPRVSQIGSLGIYDASGIDSTLGEVLAREHLPAQYYPVIACEHSWSDANALPRAHETDFLTPSTLSELHLVVPTLVDATFTPEGIDPAGWHRYAGTFRYNPCLADQTEVTRALLEQASGGAPVIIYKI